MGNPIDPAFLAKLRVLNEKYAASLPETLAAIASARALCAQAPSAPEHAKTLHQLLHTIAGSGATFGFAMLGQQSRRIEQQLRLLMKTEARIEADWQQLFNELDRFLAWADRDPKANEYNIGDAQAD